MPDKRRQSTPDLHQHLGFPQREGTAYSPQNTHADIDRRLVDIEADIEVIEEDIDTINAEIDAINAEIELIRAGSTCRVYGLSAPSPVAPADNNEYGMHWNTVQYINTNHFTCTAGSQNITVLRRGWYQVAGHLGWDPNVPPLASDGSLDYDYLRWLALDHTMHIKKNGTTTLLDSHVGSQNGWVTNEGVTVVQAEVNDYFGMSYGFFTNSSGLPSSYFPTVPTSGQAWPSMTVTYLGKIV